MYYSRGIGKERGPVTFESLTEKLGLTPRVLDVSEIDEVLAYEQARMSKSNDPEAMIKSWNAPWRKESLDHYVPKGWCFAVRDRNQKLAAYFLAQPLLFYNGLTQTLWVEYFSYEDPQVLPILVELARRYARDKHLQKVVIRSESDLSSLGATRSSPNTFEFNTTKMA